MSDEIRDPSNTVLIIDVENFGLDMVNDEPLELGFMLCDADLNVIGRNSWLVWETWYEGEIMRLEREANNGNEGSKIVVDMHTKSGLFHDAKLYGSGIGHVEASALGWLEKRGIPKGEVPLVGSSVNFDRMLLFFNFRQLFDFFHYRVIDASSFKMAAKIWRPDVYEGAKKLEPKKLHRVLPDMEDTRRELDYYLACMVMED